MNDPDYQDANFVVAWCATCNRDVLTWLADDPERHPRRCVHCDHPIADGFRLATGTELASEGYREIDPNAGCGAAGCGGGSCRRS